MRCHPHCIVPNQHQCQQWGLLPAALLPSSAAAGVGYSPLPEQQACWGGCPQCGTCGCMGGRGGKVTPHPENKSQSLNESTNHSLSAICVWAEGGQGESMQRAEGGGGGQPGMGLLPPNPSSTPSCSLRFTFLHHPNAYQAGGLLPVPCAGGDVGWHSKTEGLGVSLRCHRDPVHQGNHGLDSLRCTTSHKIPLQAIKSHCKPQNPTKKWHRRAGQSHGLQHCHCWRSQPGRTLQQPSLSPRVLLYALGSCSPN